jgi:SAM-dependent methyltransferase
MAPPATHGVRRSASLLSNFRYEQSEPARYYGPLAADTAAQVGGYVPIEGAVVADGLHLPFGDGSVDVVCTSNTLEHVREPWELLAELVRVTRTGGALFVAVTNWLSPWGGHETSPWHYLGGERAARRYQRRHGTPPKNRYGASLFEVHVGEVLRWADACPDVDLVDAVPRYYPPWTRPLLRVPGLREVAAWNLAVILRRA